MHILQSSLSFAIPSISCSSEDTPGCALATDGPGFSGETSLLVVSLGKNSPIPAKSVRHDHTYWLLMQNRCIIVNLWYFLLLFFKFKISGDCSKCDTAGNMKATRILVYAWDDCLVLPELHTCCTLLTMKNIKRPHMTKIIIFTDCYIAYSVGQLWKIQNHLAVYMDAAQ